MAGKETEARMADSRIEVSTTSEQGPEGRISSRRMAGKETEARMARFP
jgi:hypothetical protein